MAEADDSGGGMKAENPKRAQIRAIIRAEGSVSVESLVADHGLFGLSSTRELRSLLHQMEYEGNLFEEDGVFTLSQVIQKQLKAEPIEPEKAPEIVQPRIHAFKPWSGRHNLVRGRFEERSFITIRWHEFPSSTSMPAGQEGVSTSIKQVMA